MRIDRLKSLLVGAQEISERLAGEIEGRPRQTVGADDEPLPELDFVLALRRKNRRAERRRRNTGCLKPGTKMRLGCSEDRVTE
jgi:hypothetical protein